MMFGSGLDNVVEGMGADFVQDIYDRIETIANDPSLDPAAELSLLFTHLNQLLGYPAFSPEMPLATALQTFPKPLEQQLQRASWSTWDRY